MKKFRIFCLTIAMITAITLIILNISDPINFKGSIIYSGIILVWSFFVYTNNIDEEFSFKNFLKEVFSWIFLTTGANIIQKSFYDDYLIVSLMIGAVCGLVAYPLSVIFTNYNIKRSKNRQIDPIIDNVIKKVDVKSKQLVAVKCVNCGASSQKLSQITCEYCDSILSSQLLHNI